jgi:hypothetical protein
VPVPLQRPRAYAAGLSQRNAATALVLRRSAKSHRIPIVGLSVASALALREPPSARRLPGTA